jgi:TatA/E family protein of Tat protein translocase
MSMFGDPNIPAGRRCSDPSPARSRLGTPAGLFFHEERQCVASTGVLRMFGLGTQEVLVLLVLALLLFGHRLPEMARWLGRSLVEFRKETSNLTEELRSGGH